MRTFIEKLSYSTLIFLAVAFLTVVASLLAAPHPALSQSATIPITGYFWSDTIGWISLNCSTDPAGCSGPSGSWGLSIDQNGTITGDAWSDNIGWISANPPDLAGCPSAPCTATINGSGVVSGWLRALSGNTSQSGGWDGFISLNGSNYGITESGGNFSGYAWGDMNVGWIDSEYAATTYGTCTPTYSCSGETIQYTGTSCAVTNVATCSSPAFCSAGNAQCLYPSMTYSSFTDQNGMQRSGDLQLSPSLVYPGASTTVFWNVQNAQACTVTGSNGDSWTGMSSGSSGKTSGPIDEQTTYTLSCVGLDNSTTTEEQTANVVPIFREE